MTSSQKLFEISLTADTLGFPIMAVGVFVGAVVVLVYNGQSLYITSFVGFAVSIILLAAFVRLHQTQRVANATFYQSFFELKGKNLDKVAHYEDVESVGLVSAGIPSWAWGNQVSVKLKGESSPFLIHRNPKNLRMESDLYTWLSGKAAMNSPT